MVNMHEKIEEKWGESDGQSSNMFECLVFKFICADLHILNLKQFFLLNQK